ncbi:MAG TPA: 4-hydroxythreonine-4-phosphate dehydrogenase PdxA [Xanthobacteraceae bacterium]|nr:4-hydroxythreonine-4-phosphate dehydrogenase PdxA [Xanthobacteraceae bacterium]
MSLDRSDSNGTKPMLALAMGDPAGISPELTARLLALDEVRAQARLIVIGDRRVLEQGARVAGVDPDVETVGPDDPLPNRIDRPIFVDLANLDPGSVERGVATREGGGFALANYRRALTMAREARAEGVCFTPFNKQAMRLALPTYDDEIGFSSEVVGVDGPASEFNILENIWNARVTSHVRLADVAALISTQRVGRALRLTDAAMRAAGFLRPRIAVAGLNPHAGDGGNFGREEIDEIAPAVALARADGIAADGPYSPDTVFLRARNGDFDAVLTMYHDQGQIAMKLMGFDRGVTLLGGFPFPICTPAHGTAYDIAGQGIANIGATRAAVLLAARMVLARAA